MYNYQPIKAAYIRNFRNLGEVAIDFTKSPIITLIGDNEAGKTSVIKALTTVATNANPREQVSYIRDTTNQFDLAIVLQDNTTIIRSKAKQKNEYIIKYADGRVKSYQKLEGLPVEVQSLMGIIEEPETKELLQIRTYEDKLLFVVTPASTNYKVMYDALKVDQITKAIKVGNKEVNSLRNEITSAELGINTLSDSLKNTRVFDIEPLLNIKERVKKQKETLLKLKKAKDEKEKASLISQQLGVLDLILQNNLDVIDTSLIEKLEKAVYSKNKIDLANKYLENLELTEKNGVEQVDLKLLDRLENTYNLKKEVEMDSKSSELLNQIDTVELVDETLIYKLNSLVSNLNGLKDMEKEVEKLGEIENFKSIDLGVINRLERSLQEKNELNNLKNMIERLDTQAELVDEKLIKALDLSNKAIEDLNQINKFSTIEKEEIAEVERYNNILKESGAIVSECPNCGEMVVFDISNLE